ncbi:MAG: dTDP-glucose 4,6-dehydratase [Deltaproteobacteria bacterium]|nr:dTDP-glucose 4,6-dehydratase [Deltaproteobacteria bacterium]
MESILVTGGCGFIGSHFVRLLCAEEKFRVINLDKLTYAGNLENLSDLAGGFRFVRGDIADRDLVDRVLKEERPWAIVNFAAESHVDRSILDASLFLQTNIGGLHVLLEAIRAVPVKRFLHVSTDEVYGDREGRDAAAEESALRPGSPYAASKASADLLCLAYRRTYDLPIIITRSSNNYGPFQFPEKLIPLCIRNAVAGLKLPVYADGRQSRDWLHVEDNCRAILAALNKARPGSLYNIGAGGEWKNLDVVRAVCRAVAAQTGQHLEQVESNIEFVADRPGHDRRYALKTENIRRELGWYPRTGFESGLEQTVRWYLSHPDWVARVTSGEYQQYYDAVYARQWGKPS